MAAPQVYAGWRTVIKFNNEIFAAGFVVDYNIDTVHSDIQGVDNVFPDELAPQSIAVNMNLRVFRTPDNDPVALGIVPGGDQVGGGAQFAQESFLGSKYISVEIKDKVTDKTIIFLPKARVLRRSGSAEAENLLTETWSIKSIGYFGPGSQRSSLLGPAGVLTNIFS